MISKLAIATFGLALITGGCPKNSGPKMIQNERQEYGDALSRSWNELTLLNIVKIRYVDSPTFVEIGNIVTSSTLARGASAGLTHDTSPLTTLSLSGSIALSTTPTITYTPLTGAKFIRGLMTPLPPDSVFFAIQSGLPADQIMFATMASINGLKNQAPSLSGIAPADADFHTVRALVRRLQTAGAVGMYVREDANKQQTTFLTLHSVPETESDVAELRRLLHLNPEATEFKLVFGFTPANDREVAVTTRSILSLLQTLAAQVEVPAEHLKQRRAAVGFENSPNSLRLIRIHTSKSKPADASVSIRYRSNWFYIDDGDIESKQVFALMTILFSLADTGARENLPIVTIPSR